MATNYGNQYTHKLTLRLNDAQYKFLIDVSDLLGVTPSEYIRMSVNTGMVALAKNVDDLEKGKVGKSDENFKADSNNLVQ